ncbi:MAG: HEAT repeat domain-containing protein [Nostocaceae cyanobacterium]|nr:HEAT repeat domain-containing protein [Nostocaceae cyanobacterium]
MIDGQPYLKSICTNYAQWWECYTITDVVGKKHDVGGKPLLWDLKAIALPAEKQQPTELEEAKEVLNVLEGLRKYAAEHVLLIGRPGSGKSTALARLLLEEATVATDAATDAATDDLRQTDETDKLSVKKTDHLSATSGYPSGAIPVLVELRYYQTSILDLIKDFLHRHDGSLPIDDETLKNLMRQGKFLLLLDGVNELPSAAARRDLQKFRQDFHKTTPMIFTTRDLGLGGDLDISKKLQMQPLTETQMQEFVRGYLPDVGEVMLQQLGGRLREFGETPLLLMMLCSVFASNGNKLPPNLGSVFRTFTEIYDRQIKQDIPVSDESRRWWEGLLQHLAWVMMTSPQTPLKGGEGLNNSLPSLQGKGVGGLGVNASTEFFVAISRQQVEEIFTEFLEGKVNCAADCAIAWLEDLLKHHLIQLGADNKIEFRHQLIQEYYAAEKLLLEVGKLSDEQLQWDYLNYLKWTEPAVLMMELLDDEAQALRVVKLGLQVDWQLGARLAGAVKSQLQEKTVGLIYGLYLPPLLEIRLLGISKSATAVTGLIKLLEDEDYRVRSSAAYALGEIKSSAAVTGLIKLLEDEDRDVRYRAADALGEIKSSAAVTGLIKLLEDEHSWVRSRAAYALGQIKSSAAVTGLIKLLEHQDSDVRSRAAYALGEIKSSAAVTGLIKLLEDEKYHVRSSAASALGEIKSSTAVTGLIKLLEDEKYHVRSSAASALGEIKSETTIFQLIQALNTKSFITANSGSNAINAITALETIQQSLKYYQLTPILTMSTSLSHNYALLIGVGECEETKLSLPVTVKDIQALKTLLIDPNLCGYIDDEQHLRLLHDETATGENILDGLNWLQKQAKNDPEATILIYYSGHGCLDESGDYYLIPHDTDRGHIADTALSAAKFNAKLQQIPAKRLLVVIDSCHAQGMASSKEGTNNRSPLGKGFEATALPKNFIDDLKQGAGKVVFTSSTGKQSSWIRRDGKMSVYTYHFLEALQGAANQPGDKVVRVSHLMNYLAKTVPETVKKLGKEQTPFFDFATEDFPVAMLHGGKGLPTQGWEAVKPEAEEKISSISNLVNNGVGNVGDGNIGIHIGTAGNITIGDISSKS